MPIVGLFFQLQYSLQILPPMFLFKCLPEVVQKKWLLVNNCFPLCSNIKRRNGRNHGVRMEVVETEGD